MILNYLSVEIVVQFGFAKNYRCQNKFACKFTNFFGAAKLKGFTNKIVMPIMLLRKKQLQFSTILCTHHQMDTSNLAYYLK